MRHVFWLAYSCVFLCAFLLAGGTAWGQNVGSLQGQVTDPSGAAVPGAKVDATDTSSGITRTTTTDASGSYTLSQLRPATYRVRVSVQGFKTFSSDRVEVLVSTPTTLNIQLQLGSVNEAITVEAEAAPALNTTDATVGNPFDEKEVKALPFLARNAINLLTLQPGVIFTGESDTDKLAMGTISSLDDREGAVNGVRGNQTNVTVDGVDANDWQNQAAFTSALPVTLDSLQEFRVTTTNANATDGTAAGAQVALVTKSGSNDFHGNLRWYYRTTGPTANSFFNNLNGIDRPKLLRNIGGGSLGGRIIKDRIFFFVDTEERRETSAVTPNPRSVATDSLRDGALIYECADASMCPGGTVQGMTAPHVVPAGSFGLSPADIQAIDPAGLGLNPAMLAYMGIFPHGNDVPDGLDTGRNFIGFRFNAPIGLTSNVYIAKLDFNLTRDGRHAIFWRGSLEGLKDDLREAQFPGQAAASQLLNNSRGMAVQYQGQFTPSLINIFRWGFTRLGAVESGRRGPEFGVRSFAENVSFNRGFGRKVPVHEFKDDLSWVRGAHTLQFGGVFRFVRNDRQDDTLAFPGFVVNNGFCLLLCADASANVSSVLNDPAPASPSLFTRAYMMLTGSITQVSATVFADPHTKSFLPPGTTEKRSFAEHDLEAYVQDTWRLRPNLSLTVGLRYSYETPPWEVNGFQVAPTVDIAQWFKDRVNGMNLGIPSNASPVLSWDLAGRANGKSSWYLPDKKNFAPRLSLAWSPSYQNGLLRMLFGGAGKSSIRAGFGVFYNRIGEALAVDSDVNGSPGTSTFLINPSQSLTLASAPRFSGSCDASGCTGLPDVSQFLSLPSQVQFPFTPDSNASNLGFFVDRHLKTPYSMNFTLGIQRELPKKVVLDVSYVGTLGRRLLGKTDFSQYLNLKDPKSGLTLWQAYNKIVDIVGPNFFNPAVNPFDTTALASIQSIPYFDNMLPNMPAFLAVFTGDNSFGSLTPTQAFYSYVLQDLATGPSWACPLFVMDIPTLTGLPSPWSSTLDPNGTGFVIYTPQWATLPGWGNWANSNFHSLQVSVRKNVGRAVFSANYVFSRSIDNASAAENGDLNPNTNGSLNGLIQNPFDLRASRAVSDFDLRHNFNASFLVRLPFGRGERFGAHAGRLLDGLIGGWEAVGLVRWRSGFPLSPDNGFNFPTNFFLTTPGTFPTPVTTSVIRKGPDNVPNLFQDRDAVLKVFAFTRPGASGSRNVLRSPAFATLDAGVHKSIKMPWSERQKLQLRLTAFNVLNSVNLATGGVLGGIDLDPTSPATFGKINATAGPRGGAREMEFAVRFEF